MLIVGLFLPLVIQAEPFGDTEVMVFDTDFLSAPAGPDPEIPAEPPLPGWIVIAPAAASDLVLPPPVAEQPS